MNNRSHGLVRWGLAAALGMNGASARVAWAQEASTQRPLAESLFREAQSLIKSGRTSEACIKLAESERLDPQVGTLMYLATCHATEGKSATAWIEFNDAAARADRAGQPDRARLARERAAAIERKLSKLTLRGETLFYGTEIRIDGTPIGHAALGEPFPLDPGSHRIEFSAPGKARFRTDIVIPAGPSETVFKVPLLEDTARAEPATTPSPAPSSEPARAAPSSEPPTHSTLHTTGYVIAGVGVVGVGIGSYFGLRALSKQSDADRACDLTTCSRQGLDDNDSAHRSATLSTIAFGAGGAALVGGALIVWLTKTPSGGRAIAVSPYAGPTSAGISTEVKF